jgi:hypothetical protein
MDLDEHRDTLGARRQAALRLGERSRSPGKSAPGGLREVERCG